MAFTQHPKTGTTISSDDMTRHFERIDSRVNRVVSGFNPSTTTSSLVLTVGAGVAYIAGRQVGKDSDNDETVSMAANDTNHVWLREDGSLFVNQSGVAPSGNSFKLFVYTTDANGVPSGAADSDLRHARVEYDAEFRSKTYEATQSGVNLKGHRGAMKGSVPYWELEDTATPKKTRIRANNGKVEVFDPDSSEVLMDLRAPLGGKEYIETSEKGANNGVATLSSTGVHPAAQYRDATESAKGGALLANAVAQTLGAANTKGASTRLARMDHTHAHGDRSGDVGTQHAMSQISGEISNTQHGDRGGGSLHSNATAGAAGFMPSTDKTKLDAATASDTANTLILRDANKRAKVAKATTSTEIANLANLQEGFNPDADNTREFGSNTLRWKRIRATEIVTGDLGLNDPVCVACDRYFVVGDKLVMQVRAVEDGEERGNVLLTVPVHAGGC